MSEGAWLLFLMVGFIVVAFGALALGWYLMFHTPVGIIAIALACLWAFIPWSSLGRIFLDQPETLMEEQMAQLDITLTSQITPGRYSDKSGLYARGTVRNNSPVMIESVFVECRVPDGQMGSVATTGRH
jgi:hypothetical protein